MTFITPEPLPLLIPLARGRLHRVRVMIDDARRKLAEFPPLRLERQDRRSWILDG